MRLFTAVPVPSPARDELVSLLQRLRETGLPVRWVREQGLHITLKFFGEVGEPSISGLSEALARAAGGTGSIPITCHGIGAFPTLTRARVIWIGAEAPAALELLQDGIERACEPLGFPSEGRPFHPHITLGRVREGERVPADVIEGVESPEVPFLAEQLVLYRSQPGRGGSVYDVVHTIPLA